MRFSLAPRSRRDVLLHLTLMLVTLATLVVGFFYVYLPYVTRHGQTVQVPGVVGLPLSQVADRLEATGLEYLVDDSTYNPDAAPLTVYQQFPAAGATVKMGRKIFLSINARRPPMVSMPTLVGRSVINAQNELESHGLRLGKTEYVADLQQNAVLKQQYQGREIKPGDPLPKGASVDLVVGDGLGQQELNVPSLQGRNRDEAEFILSGLDLQLGTIIYEASSTAPAGTVTRQKPAAGGKIRVGDMVDLWIAGPDPARARTPDTDEGE